MSRLLVLTMDWAPIEGGIASLTEGVSRALARRGHRLTVIAPSRPGARQSSIEDGIRIERFRGYDLGHARVVPFAALSLRRIAGHDAVLAMNPGQGGMVAALARGLGGPPYLAWAYGFELLKSSGTPLVPLYRQVFSRARAAIAISGYTASLLGRIGVPAAAIRIVPPGIDPPPPPPTADELAAIRSALAIPEGRIVLTVGRLIARKGHPVLLRAMREVMAARPDVVWVVAGRGPLAAELAAESRALGVAARVALPGYVPPRQLEALYRLATVFALTPAQSERDAEGFGIVFLEAGARGIPVVAARSGGIPDAVLDGKTGILVSPDDAPEIARALLAVLDQPALARRLGEGGAAHAAFHAWDRIAATIEDLLPTAPEPAPR